MLGTAMFCCEQVQEDLQVSWAKTMSQVLAPPLSLLHPPKGLDGSSEAIISCIQVLRPIQVVGQSHVGTYTGGVGISGNKGGTGQSGLEGSTGENCQDTKSYSVLLSS